MSLPPDGAPRRPDKDDQVETARRMSRALDYLIGVSAATGLSRVAAKLVAAQAELLMTSGRAILRRETPSRRDRAGSAEDEPQRH